MPLVTIAIPVYNVEKYIKSCLQSVLCQSYKNIEVLIIDDCGTDGSMDIVRQIKNINPRGGAMRIISNKQNQGIATVRNQMIDEANGDYLFFLDSDDYITEDAISIMVDSSIRYQSEVTYASFRTIYNSSYHDLVLPQV